MKIFGSQCLTVLAVMAMAASAAAGNDADIQKTAADADEIAPASWSPRPFTANYKVLHGRTHVGDSSMTLSIDDDGLYEYRNDAEARGMARWFVKDDKIFGFSRFEIDGGAPKPLLYESDGPKKNDNQSITFNYIVDQAFSSYEGEQAVLDLDPLTLDMLSMDIALMLRMKNAQDLTTMSVIYRNESQRYEFGLEGDERVDTEAGQFETVRVRRQREGSSRHYLLWLAPTLDYLPVRVDQYKKGELNNTMVLTSYTSTGQ